ncbi:hypothetical protein PENANT_c002G04364 [Penicillium antarcticum]|uniref:Uncharacterized protein n=1 Tax=Penicillium antarcticum TaxID=416450 RepID=A0A1V6QL15_9EURO|nr:uncharacterized protein N7508_006406 [Penicillium antarcticum]KAJ5301543.1 hypothetical protein N7508_006406 [Penicillium antarcticum]OQD89662.1 hypothetical protein PENANT_c002G04364 [Penicillium antarcticum]
MKFSVVSALFLATAAMATPEIGDDINNLVTGAEGVYSTAKADGQSIGSDAAAEATSIANAVHTGGAAAVSTLTGAAGAAATAAENEASTIASDAQSRASDARSQASTWVTGHTLTNSEGSATATVSTTMTTTTGETSSTGSSSDSSSTGSSASESASGSSSTSDNGAFARPTAIGAAAAGMAGVLGFMVAL